MALRPFGSAIEPQSTFIHERLQSIIHTARGMGSISPRTIQIGSGGDDGRADEAPSKVRQREGLNGR
jgi:hypothetical protein